ncbi:MAG: nucleotidyltransferase domain-containing protein [Oscillospiraceae bacterium]|nr:nucleotidyltransferase domain-containing protein [Oscillospiraceae bacterium]
MTISEIKRHINPVAKRYGVERVMLFGSYARGEADGNSDVDLRIDSGALRGYFKLAGFQREASESLNLPVDVLTTGALDDTFLTRIAGEEVLLYEAKH